MEQKENRRDTAVRLACCAVIALIICYGAEKLGEHLKLPLWEEHGHLLKENKVQAVAILAALFFVAGGAYLLGKFSRRRDELIRKLLKLKR